MAQEPNAARGRDLPFFDNGMGARQLHGCKTTAWVPLCLRWKGRAAARLPELHVIELRVGVDVGVGDADELAAALRGRIRIGRIQRLQHHYQRHIVLSTANKLRATQWSEEHDMGCCLSFWQSPCCICLPGRSAVPVLASVLIHFK